MVPDTSLLVAVEKIVKLIGIEDEEVKQLQYLNYGELIEKRDEYVEKYVEILNGFLSEKVQLKKEISGLKTWKGIAIGVGSIVKVFGIIISAKTEKRKQKTQKTKTRNQLNSFLNLKDNVAYLFIYVWVWG